MYIFYPSPTSVSTSLCRECKTFIIIWGLVPFCNSFSNTIDVVTQLPYTPLIRVSMSSSILKRVHNRGIELQSSSLAELLNPGRSIDIHVSRAQRRFLTLPISRDLSQAFHWRPHKTKKNQLNKKKEVILSITRVTGTEDNNLHKQSYIIKINQDLQLDTGDEDVSLSRSLSIACQAVNKQNSPRKSDLSCEWAPPRPPCYNLKNKKNKKGPNQTLKTPL